MKNRLEIMELINERLDYLYVYRLKDANEYVPIRWRGIYRPAGVCLHVFDDCGSRLFEFYGFVPIEGGTILYFVGDALD